MSMQKRKPYENNHVMCYEDLKKFFIQELELNYPNMKSLTELKLRR